MPMSQNFADPDVPVEDNLLGVFHVALVFSSSISDVADSLAVLAVDAVELVVAVVVVVAEVGVVGVPIVPLTFDPAGCDVSFCFRLTHRLSS